MKWNQLLRKSLPDRLILSVRKALDSMVLAKLPETACDVNNLLQQQSVKLSEIFASPASCQAWEEMSPRIAGFGIPDGTGGVNPGDRRAIFHLIHYLKPKSVLEVGTHIGASTVHIAAALSSHKFHNKPSLISVDIACVNDPEKKPWVSQGAKYSPAEMAEAFRAHVDVEFVAAPSVQFMADSNKKYDFIFLDGDHSARTVYTEIPMALKLLNPGGSILLHDYFPKLKPLWKTGAVIPGPFLAVERLICAGGNVAALPLGSLPWETKKGSTMTSLSLLARN